MSMQNVTAMGVIAIAVKLAAMMTSDLRRYRSSFSRAASCCMRVVQLASEHECKKVWLLLSVLSWV